MSRVLQANMFGRGADPIPSFDGTALTSRAEETVVRHFWFQAVPIGIVNRISVAKGVTGPIIACRRRPLARMAA